MSTSLDSYFALGETITLGSHTFEPEEIKTFARNYDPQPFHVDEEAAKSSVFGRLCASGWHTASMWMRYNLKLRETAGVPNWEGPEPRPVFGPSPGFTNLKWLKPVYAGDTITFYRTAIGHRAAGSRQGWRILTIRCDAANQDGAPVLTFESAVLVKVA